MKKIILTGIIAIIIFLAFSCKSTDAKVQVSQSDDEAGLKSLCADYFKLGCGLTGSSPQNCAINLPKYMELVEKHFSSCTMTNLMKPAYILNQTKSIKNFAEGKNEAGLVFGAIDSTLEWCAQNNVQMRGHTLVWHTQVPDWFFKEGFKNDGELVTRDEMIERLDSFIKQYLDYVQTNYPGLVYCWDVVNEAVDPVDGDKESFFRCRIKNGNEKNLWYYTIGADYPEVAFRIARKYAAPGVSLFYNDYTTVDSTKRELIYKLCKDLKEKGLIDGIGMQAYWDMNYPSLVAIDQTIRRFSELGLEIQLTEWSIPAPSEDAFGFLAQGERYATIFRLLQKLDTQGGGPANITCVSFFGVMDGYPLYQNDTTTTRIFDKNYQPKLAFKSIKNTFLEYYQ